MIQEQTEIAVVGGGLVGAAIAWGLARLGKRVTVLDEGDNAFRASRGNFALVWVQSKGLGMPEYAAWTKRSADAWAGLASALKDETAIDVAHHAGRAVRSADDEVAVVDVRALAPARGRRQAGVRDPVRHRDPVRARKRAEVLVERPVLLHDHDHVLDLLEAGQRRRRAARA